MRDLFRHDRVVANLRGELYAEIAFAWGSPSLFRLGKVWQATAAGDRNRRRGDGGRRLATAWPRSAPDQRKKRLAIVRPPALPVSAATFITSGQALSLARPERSSPGTVCGDGPIRPGCLDLVSGTYADDATVLAHLAVLVTKSLIG